MKQYWNSEFYLMIRVQYGPVTLYWSDVYWIQFLLMFLLILKENM